jgi:hypothetical protein
MACSSSKCSLVTDRLGGLDLSVPTKSSIIGNRFVQAWIELHHDDLSADWELADTNYFNLVGICFGTITWQHEQVIAPETLHADMRVIEPGN